MGKRFATTVRIDSNYYTMEEKWVGWLGIGNGQGTGI